MDGGSAPTSPPPGAEEIDLYEILGVERDATPDQIKKAFKVLALKHHPDKVGEHLRKDAEEKFKVVQHAYDILREPEKRALYDAGGIAAVNRGMPGEGGLEDILSQMFGGGFGGFGGPGGHGGGGRSGPRQGPSERQEYKVTLEELYRGKTVKFQANKQVICPTCSGSGAKDKVKPEECTGCNGMGKVQAMRQIGPLMTQEVRPCPRCGGSGRTIKEKDKCKKCKGKRTTKETKALEIYIPRGSMQGDTIVVEGEADQEPDTTPGDIIFQLVEETHDVFTRIGPDLSADLTVTLAEALCGFSRTVLTHLDGRGIHITRERNKILRPGEVLKVPGEGMPHRKGDAKGDLYLIVRVDFPEDGWLKTDTEYEALQALLPGPMPAIKAEEVDEVEYEDDADIEEMGANSGDPRGNAWEDDDEDHEGHHGTQCATQ